MSDKYFSFLELRKDRPSSYTVYSNFQNSKFLIFTPHGGGIEPGTTELCKWFDDNLFSCYIFSGVGRKCKELHITSHRFDEPELLKMLKQHEYAVSFHGMSNKMKQEYNADIFLGGLNKIMVSELYKKLEENGYSVTTSDSFPQSTLAAHDLNNVTNKCTERKGVQIELSEDLRKSFFKMEYSKKIGRKYKTTDFEHFCKLIKESLDKHKKEGQ